MGQSGPPGGYGGPPGQPGGGWQPGGYGGPPQYPPRVYPWDRDGLVWVCMDCGSRAAADGACPACSSSPLLDLRKENVRDMLIEDDQRRSSARNDKVRWMSVIASMVIVGVPSFLFPPIGLAVLGVGPFFTGPIFCCLIVCVAIMAVMKWGFPFKKRFPYVAR
jgi:hypothetical protein